MVDAPERLWVQPENRTPIDEDPRHAGPHDVEYVRADLYEQVKRERDEANAMLADAYGSPVEGHKLFDERLAGARVVTLEWRGTEGVWAKADALFGATYRITEYAGMAKPFKLETVGFVGPHGHYGTLDDAKAAAQSDYERRILSALAEPAGEFDRIVSDSSEFVASLSDSMRATGRSVFNPPEPTGKAEPVACVACEDRPKGENNPCAVCGKAATLEPAAPEGQQPVAFVDLRVLGSLAMGRDAVECTLYAKPNPDTLSDVAIYTRPSEQAVTVTEAMVEAVQRIRETAMRQSVVARIPECGEFGGIAQDADWLLDTLNAAMEEGR